MQAQHDRSGIASGRSCVYIEEESSVSKKRVLSVGQCSVDHRAISHLMKNRFTAEVVSVDDWKEAKSRLAEESFDLVLVNRKLDRDYSDGIDVIRQLKADEEHATLPVMLVTNYPEHQEQAMEVGAERGFGKLEYEKPETIEKLSRFLGDESSGNS